MSGETHFDGGRLRRSSTMHRHVIEHDDGRVSAIVVRGVPALVCDLCEETYYEPEVTDAVVAILNETEVAPGEAIAVEYRTAQAVA
jgi:YgiT-type zinc finger domain-containing protein